MDPNGKKIIIIHHLDSSDDGALVRGARKPKPTKEEVSAAALGANLDALSSAIAKALDSVGASLTSFELDEVSVEIEFLAGGMVGLLGSGAYGEMSSGATLVFKRKQKK